MGKRKESVLRAVAFFWAMVAAFIAGFVSVVGFFWGVVDVVWQFIFGSDGLSASSRPAVIVKNVLYWPIDLTVFAFTGSGEMMWLPDLG